MNRIPTGSVLTHSQDVAVLSADTTLDFATVDSMYALPPHSHRRLGSDRLHSQDAEWLFPHSRT